MTKSIINLVKRKYRREFWGLIVIMFVGALLEMVGISMIGTVCALLMDDAAVMNNAFIAAACRWIGVQPGRAFATNLLIALIVFYFFKVIYLLAENFAVAKYVRTVQHEISTELYDGLLRGPYDCFTQTSASSLTALLETDLLRASSYLSALLQTVTEGLVTAAVSLLLLVMNPVMTLFVLCGLGVAFALSSVLVRWRTYQNGQVQRQANRRRLKWLHQGIYGIKDVKIGQTEDFFSARYSQADEETARAARVNQFLTKAPMLSTEAIMAASVLLYVLSLVRSGQNVTGYLPSLSALVLAAIRLLPSCSRINSGLNQMSGLRPSVEAIGEALERVRRQRATGPSAEQREISLSRSIRAEGVTFSYEGRTEPVLEDVDMEIPVGASVGIVGPSGAGKTTLVDVLLGLLQPRQGAVYADGVDIRDCLDSYLRKIAYIPQNIFLLDDTVRSNVAFGVPAGQVRDEDVWRALEEASLAGMVRGLPEGLDTVVGENGIRLSGGERQRLGIARALYQDCGVMIFDEATSALDPDTEQAIIQSVYRFRGERTTVIISHRATAVAGCDRIYRVEGSHVCPVKADPADDRG